jgi:DNA-binding NarL/FixJ family response regulator
MRANPEKQFPSNKLFQNHQPDIVLMDLRLPGMSGVEAILTIRHKSPDARIIVNTPYDAEEDIHRAIQSGAKSYLLKDMPKEEILGVIRSVHAGHAVLPSQVETRLKERMARPALTNREIAVVELLVKGRSNKEIGDHLGISEPAVKFRIQRILSKLDAVGSHQRRRFLTAPRQRAPRRVTGSGGVQTGRKIGNSSMTGWRVKV